MSFSLQTAAAVSTVGVLLLDQVWYRGGCRIRVPDGGQDGGAKWGCRVRVHNGGAGWWYRMGMQNRGAGRRCRMGVHEGGTGWGAGGVQDRVVV